MAFLTYRKIDAFTSAYSSGNPAACIYLQEDQSLSEAEMLGIAKAHKGFVSEVVYCEQLGSAHYKLSYYSSECEVAFCGHGTIACMYDLIKTDTTLHNLQEIKISTKKGDLTVFNKIKSQDAVLIAAPEPQYFESTPPPDDIAHFLDITAEDIEDKFKIQCIDAGLKTLIVPIKNLDRIIAIAPNEANLKEFCLSNDIDIILVFTTDIFDRKNIARTRVFAPKFGYLEDKATGSGNSALAYYMLKYAMWDGSPTSIEQNDERVAHNIIKLELARGGVLFGGSATTKIRGDYIL